MRIISGRFGGRVLKAPKGRDTRPTTDRVREAIASSVVSACGPLDGMHALDAFAGSGALGLEMLSRGCETCLFFDIDRNAREAILSNIASLGLPKGQARVISADCMKAARKGPIRRASPFDIVLLDPPYATDSKDVLGLIDALALNGDLADTCLVVYEHRDGDFDAEVQLPCKIAARPVALHAQKSYGIVGVTMFRL